MSEQDPIAVAVARAHVEAWGRHDYDAARTRLAADVHVVLASVDAGAPEMTAHSARLYRLDESQKIVEERVIFFLTQ